jgi:tape measure domain-containing protein
LWAFYCPQESEMTQESRLVIVIDSKNAERNTRAVADELANLTNKGVQADAQMTAMSSSIKSLVGYMGGLLTINKAIAMADGYTQMAARIRNATQSADEYTLVQDRLLKTANTTYRQLGEAQEVYLSMAGGMKSLGKSTKDTLDLTDSLSFSFTHNATRVDQAQSAMDALSKSMAKGKIDGDAWISIVTGADNVISDMAKTTGKTEAEIRKLGVEGKISLEDLIKTLIATREQNEKLANNMENSLADGFTKLSNNVTDYLGKVNESTSATGMLAGGLGLLADNLDAVANTGAVLGIGYVTTALLTKSAVVKKDIIDSMTQRAATKAQALASHERALAEVSESAAILKSTQAQVANTQATLAAITAEKALEVERLKAQMNSAGRTAAVTRMAELKKVEALVTRELAVAETTLAAAQARSTAAATAAAVTTSRLALAARGVLSFLGGPVGLGITVASLAAGYFMMSSSADKANAKLEEQGKIAEKTNEELKKLTGNDKKSAIDDLTAAFTAQNIQLGKSKEAVDAVLFAIRAVSVENEKARKVTEDARRGVISYDEAIKRLNEMDVPTDLYDMLKKQAKEYDVSTAKANTSKVAFKAFGIEVKLAGNEAQNASSKIAGNTKELNANETAAQKAARAQQSFKDSLYDREYEAYVTKGLLAKGYSEEQVKAMVDAANYAKKEGIQITNEMYQAALKVVDIEQKNKDVIDARNKAQKENTNEVTKQQKVLQASAKVQANAAKYNFGGLESKYNLPNGMLSALHAIETGNSGKTNQVNKQSGATGGFQFLKGTANQYGVKDRTDMAQSAEGAAKYMAYLLKLFKGDLEKAVRAYHAGEGNVQKGKNIGKYNNDYWQKFKGYSAGANGYSAGDISSKDFEKILEDAAKLAEEQAKLRKSLELEVASEVTRIRSKLSDDLQEIDKAGYSSEKAKELKAEYQARADNDIAIANYALKTKLDDYEAFKKTESELLKQSFDEKKFYAVRDLELSKDDRAKAVQFLDDQLKQELALIMLAKETRLFQMQQGLMHASAQSDRYWDLERQRIMLSVQDLKERNRQLAIANELHAKEKFDNLNGAAKEWGSINANMTGRGDQWQLQQEDESRAKASEELLLAELDLANTAAQREAIWKAHHERMSAIEKAYQARSIGLQAGQAAQFAGIMQGMVSESSSAYALLGAAQQGFALFSTAMNSYTAISAAWASAPFPYNLPAVGIATMETGLLQAAVSAMSPVGMAHSGIDKIPKEGTWLLDKDERVLSPRQNRDFTEFMAQQKDTRRVGMGALDAINNGGTIQAEKQAQANAKAQSIQAPNVNLNPHFTFVDQRENPHDFMYGPNGEKAVMRILKRNGVV